MKRIFSTILSLKSKGFVLLFLALAISTVAVKADTTWVSGEQASTWSLSGSPYMITDSAWVVGETFTVQAGVVINFLDSASQLTVLSNRMDLVGTENDSIFVNIPHVNSVFEFRLLTNQRIECEFLQLFGPGSTYWRADSIFLNHCSQTMLNDDVVYANGSIWISDFCSITNSIITYEQVNNSDVVMANVLLEYNLSMVACGNVIVDSLFPLNGGRENEHLSVFSWISNDSVQITNSCINSLHVRVDEAPAMPIIVENTSIGAFALLWGSNFLDVYESYFDKLSVWNCEGAVQRSLIHEVELQQTRSPLVFKNNTIIQYLDCAPLFPTQLIYCVDPEELEFVNNIFFSNQPDVTIFGGDIIPMNIRYNLTFGMNYPWGILQLGPGNINMPPQFDPHDPEYGLCYDSPARNAGDPNLSDADGSRSDIGARWWNEETDHPPVILTPPLISIHWGDHFDFILSATDEGHVNFNYGWVRPSWMFSRQNLDETSETIFSGVVPFGVSSFDILLRATDLIGQNTTKSVHVEVLPRSTLTDTVRGILPIEYSPYTFMHDVVIPRGDTLIVDPGVHIQADSMNCEPALIVDGYLQAFGIETDSIYFESLTNRQWRGLFLRDSASTSLDYAVIRQARTAVQADSAHKVELRHSTLKECSPSLTNPELCFRMHALEDSLIIRTSSFDQNSAVSIVETSYLIDSTSFQSQDNDHYYLLLPSSSVGSILNSTFENNDGGAIQVISGSINVQRNTFHGFENAVVVLWIDSPTTISNNVFDENSNSAVVFLPIAPIHITNNIIKDAHRAIGVMVGGNLNNIQLSNNCIFDADSLFWPGQGFIIPELVGELSDININGDSMDVYGNIFLDPLFADELYHLNVESPCIDAGYDYGQEYSGLAPDMGRWEFGENLSDISIQEISLNISTNVQIFPNPSNSVPQIIVQTQFPSDIFVYDILGRLLKSEQNIPFGTHIVDLSSSVLTTGTYFFTLHSYHGIATKAFTIIR